MATQTNYCTNPNFNADLTDWAEFQKITGVSSWWDSTNGSTVRLQNAVSAFYGRVMTLTLPAGTYHASIEAQTLSGTTNVSWLVRKQGASTWLVEQHWTTPDNTFSRKGGAFTLTSTTTIEIIAALGGPNATSAGSVRFDKCLVTEGSTQLAYFDGDTVDTSTINYSWSGAANASKSVALDLTIGGGGSNLSWYQYGAAPNVDSATMYSQIRAIYDATIAALFTQSGMPAGMTSGAWRVQRIENGNDTVSEGIGYGMLICAIVGNPQSPIYDSTAKAKFDGLWSYYKFFRNSNGLMNWHISNTGTVIGTGGATDADQDVAQALDLADKTWGSTSTNNYAVDAIALINAIGTYEYVPATGHANPHFQTNGDQWGYDTDRYMADYFAPAFMRNFQTRTGDAAWATRITTNYPAARGYFDTHYSTGMIPDESKRDGTVSPGNSYKFSYNAIRGFRTVLDYLWNGANADSLAHTQATKLANFAVTQSGGNPANLKAEYDIDGTNFASYTNMAFVQAFGVAALADASHSDFSAACLKYIYDNRSVSGNANYFGLTLGTISALIMGGLFKPLTSSTAGGGTTTTHPGWDLVEANDFSGSAVDETRFYIYDGFVGTNGCGTYSRSRVSVSGGQLLMAPIGDSIPGISSKRRGMKGGRWEVGVKWNAKQGYKLVIFLWPDARPPDNKEHWSDGELDFFECIDTSGNTFAIFFHNSTGTPSKNQAFNTSIPVVIDDVIKQVACEWVPGSHARVLVNDTEVFKTTDLAALPVYACHLVAQMDVGVPNSSGTKSDNGVSIRPSYPTAYTGSDVPTATIDYINIYSIAATATPPSGGNQISIGATEDLGAAVDSAKMRLGAALRADEVVTKPKPVTNQYGEIPWGSAEWDGNPFDAAYITLGRNIAVSEPTYADADQATLTVSGRPELPAPPAIARVLRDRWIWVSTTTGNQLELTGFVDGVEMLRGASGLLGPPSRITRKTVPGRAGAVTTDKQHGVKTLALPLVEQARNWDSSMELLARMVQMMDPITNEGILRFVSKDGHVSELFAQCTDGLGGSDLGGLGPTAQSLPITLEAEDPYWYRTPVTLGFKGSDALSWFPIFPDDGRWLGSSSVIGDVVVTTKSDVPTWPVWSIVGPGSNPLLTSNHPVVGQRALGLNASLAASQAINIDTRERGATAKTVIGPDGSNWFGKLDAATRSLWALQPGNNPISIVVVDAQPETYVSLTYRDATLMP